VADPPPKLVLVEWIDSNSPSPQEWQDTDEFLESRTETLGCRTVGFLMFEAEDRIGLASSMALRDDSQPAQVSGTIIIPKVAITKMRKLK